MTALSRFRSSMHKNYFISSTTWTLFSSSRIEWNLSFSVSHDEIRRWTTLNIVPRRPPRRSYIESLQFQIFAFNLCKNFAIHWGQETAFVTFIISFSGRLDSMSKWIIHLTFRKFQELWKQLESCFSECLTCNTLLKAYRLECWKMWDDEHRWYDQHLRKWGKIYLLEIANRVS